MSDLSPLIVVLGPTATGKSLLAAHLARRLGGEVVGFDSAQVYRRLDAATGKPPARMRREIRHHLVDVADPGNDFSAGDFARLAESAIASIQAAGRRAILAGGTGLYLRSLLGGLAPMPRRDERLRSALLRWAARRGEGALHAMLRGLDPASAARLPPRDTQRIVRAVEVALLTGRTLTDLVARQPFGPGRYRAVKVGLTMPWSLLTPRIERRVDGFFAAGLIEEVRALLADGVPMSANCFKALGYREALELLAGVRGLAETVDLVKANTRRYARRQLVWFRREPDVVWFEMGERPEERFAEIEADVTLRMGAPMESRHGHA